MIYSRVATNGAGVRGTNAIERLHEEFKRTIKTQTVLPLADLCCSFRPDQVDGWPSLATTPIDQPIDLAAQPDTISCPENASRALQPTTAGTSGRARLPTIICLTRSLCHWIGYLAGS
jgi:hypothetical protein